MNRIEEEQATASILKEIIENKNIELEQGVYHFDGRYIAKSTRSLWQSIKDNPPGFILECKAASPSKGLMCKNYQPRELALTYQPYAAAISVLTDQKYFSGNFEHLQQVSNAVDIPVLCKDFFIDPEQVQRARQHGADAILIMLSVVDDALYQRLADTASSLDMDVLTEVHQPQEIQRAINLGAKIIGINNRDLHSLKTDISLTISLSDLIPDDVLLISESGFSQHTQIEQMKNLKRPVDGFLIGSHLSQSEYLIHELKQLKYGAVKICGITSVFDAMNAFESGVSYGGLIFSHQSSRKVSLDKAKTIVGSVNLKWVGVFTETSLEEIETVVYNLKLSAVQIHWHATEAFFDALKNILPERCEIWQVLKIHDLKTLQHLTLTSDSVDRLLIEPTGELAGGNGLSFPWDNINLVDRDFSKIIVAGGINPSNIQQIKKYQFGIVDVNSGVETKPGVKSLEKIAQLFSNLLLSNEQKRRVAE